MTTLVFCYTFLMKTAVVSFLCFTFLGCANISTYPPVENDSFLSNPNSANEPVPTIMVDVLKYAHEHFGGMDTIVFNLPVGVNRETYTIVADRLGGATPMTNENQVAFHITELRVRGFSAEADVTFPSSGGGYEKATVYLQSSPFGVWEVVDERVWLIPSQNAPNPNFSSDTNLDSKE